MCERHDEDTMMQEHTNEKTLAPTRNWTWVPRSPRQTSVIPLHHRRGMSTQEQCVCHGENVMQMNRRRYPVGTQLLQKVIMESLNWSNPIKRLFMETSVSSNDPIKENMYSTCLTTACIRVFQCHQRHTVAVETKSWFTRVTNIPMSDNPQGVGIRYDHISLTTKSSDSQSYQAMTGAPHWRAPWGYALGV